MPSSIEKRTISRPAEQARYIDTLVSSGGYASASAVVRAGLRAMQERDAALDRWVRDTVMPRRVGRIFYGGRDVAALPGGA